MPETCVSALFYMEANDFCLSCVELSSYARVAMPSAVGNVRAAPELASGSYTALDLRGDVSGQLVSHAEVCPFAPVIF